MADLVLVSDIITSVRRRADIESSQVCTDAELISLVNSAYKEFYSEVVKVYEDYFISSTPVAVVSGTDTYALPSDFLKLKGIDQSVNGESVSLSPFNFAQRNKRSAAFRSSQFAYIVQGANVRFVPAPTASETLTLWYVPRATAVTLSSQSLDVINGFDDFIVDRVAQKVMEKQQLDSGELYRSAEKRKVEIAQLAVGRDAGEVFSLEDTLVEW